MEHAFRFVVTRCRDGLRTLLNSPVLLGDPFLRVAIDCSGGGASVETRGLKTAAANTAAAPAVITAAHAAVAAAPATARTAVAARKAARSVASSCVVVRLVRTNIRDAEESIGSRSYPASEFMA